MKNKLIKGFMSIVFLIVTFFLISPIALLFLNYFHVGVREIINPVVVNAILISIKSTSISLLIILILGIPSSYLLARTKIPCKNIIDILIELPLVLPPAVSGLLLLITFGKNGFIGKFLLNNNIKLPFSFWAVVLAQVFVSLPMFIKTAKAGFMKVDRNLEQAAATLGDKPWEIMLRVTLPLSIGNIVTGAILAWARSLAEFGATIMFAGNLMGRTQTLPLAIYSTMETGIQLPLAIAVILVSLSLLVLVIVKIMVKKYSI